jgi:hypothetical protein
MAFALNKLFKIDFPIKKTQPILHRMKNLQKLLKSKASMQVQSHLNLNLIVTRARQNRQLISHTYKTKFSLINNIILFLTFFKISKIKENPCVGIKSSKKLVLGGQLSKPPLKLK